MHRWRSLLLVPLLLLLLTMPARAIELSPILINPNLLVGKPVPIAFGAVPNRYTGVDPATTFDLNGDLVGDLKVTPTEVLGQNGAMVQLLNPPELNLDQVQQVPSIGYAAKAQLQLSRVYVAKLSNVYVKFMILQASPKVTIWFMYGQETSSLLKADGSNSQALLTWDPLPDASVGYNVYRYDVSESSYTVTVLNDFAIKETTFTDKTAANRYYLYVVQAIKAGGSPGGLTTVAPTFVQSKSRRMVVGINTDQATVDGVNVKLPAKTTIKHGRLMVPASLLAQAGAKVTFDAGSGRLTISRRFGSLTYTVSYTVDAPEYTVNGTTQKDDVPPFKQGNEVMVSLRTVAPTLGLGVTFNSESRQAEVGWFE